jgi:hypothetical protein
MEYINMKQVTIFILACGAVWIAPAQEAQRNFPSVLPGKGLAQHDFFYAGEAKTQDMYIVRNGKVPGSFTTPREREKSAMQYPALERKRAFRAPIRHHADRPQ